MSQHQSEILYNYNRYRQDPWAFLSECVFTQDQVDQKEPIKAFPKHFEYLELFSYIFQQKNLIAVPKSRRMTMSWTCISLILWDTIFHKGRNWAFVSKKEEDAADLVSRAKFIYDHIPPDKIPPDLLPKLDGGKMTKKPPAMTFPDIHSKIQGFPMGADQLRQFTFSGIFGDECAFWDVAQKFYSSAKPTIDGGGKMVLVSSRAPGFFKKIVYDQLDNLTNNFPEIPPAEVKKPIEGVEVWQNPKNKFTIVDIHYTANPAKRGKEFREAVKSAMPIREFLMEYEKNWDTYEGLPVFPDFRKDVHISKIAKEPEIGLPLLCGVDFGLTPAVLVTQMQGNHLICLKEYEGHNEGIKQFLTRIMPDLRRRFNPWLLQSDRDYYWFIDPAGFQKNQVDARTCAGEMRTLGLNNILPGPIDFETRRKSVERFLLYTDREGPGLVVNQKECPTLIEGLQGGYRYPERVMEEEPTKIRPMKDRHCVDSETEMLTMGGWKKFNELRVGMPVYEYDMENDRIIEGQLKDIHIYNEQSEVLRFANKKHELYFTPNHQCVTITKIVSKPQFKYAKDLVQGNQFISPKFKEEPPKKHNLSDEFVELAAWIMTEGSKRESSGAYIITQSIDHNPHHVERIDHLVSKFNGCFRKRDQTGGIHKSNFAAWHIRSDVQFMLDELMPGRSKIPTHKFIELMNNRQRRLFIYTAMCGDGDCANSLTPGLKFSRNREMLRKLKTPRIKLKSKLQIDALQVMATLTGLASRVTEGGQGYWSLILSKKDKQKTTDIQNMSIEHGVLPMVWCPETVTHTWIMRRNGQVYVTGNSHIQDALQYVAHGALRNTNHNIQVAGPPTYNFGDKGTNHGKERQKELRKLFR